MLGLCLGLTSTARAIAPPQGGVVITLADFSRDRVVFDSGAARGVNSGLVALSGTATAGQTVQARAMTETGAAVTGWATVATAAAGGAWSGTMAVPRNAAWLRAQVRLAAAPAVTATTINRFGVGHVIALWGQSELAGILVETAASGEVLAADDRVQVLGPSASPTQVRHVSAAAPISSSVVALANALHDITPDDKFALVFHCVSGTGWDELFDDTNMGRSWPNEVALHETATADGQSVGLATMSWFADPRGQGSTYGEVAHRLMFGRTVAGEAVTFPAVMPGGWTPNWTANHHWGDLYDYALTRWLPYGPHRFDITVDMRNALVRADGVTDAAIGGIPINRASWRTMIAASAEPALLDLGIEPLSYLNGHASGASWTDTPHPGTLSVHGKPRWARYTAIAMAQGLGLASPGAADFDQSAWAADGSYFEIWSSAGPITTTRRVKGWAALPTTFAHWTEVWGFEVNSLPATRAEIVAGRVRIYPRAPDTRFYQGDTVAFGRGGAGGLMETPEDYANNGWANLPIVAISPVSGIEGIDLRPLPAAAILANPITVTRPTIFTDAFTRADGTLIAGGWSLLFGSANTFTITSNAFLSVNTTEGGVACPAIAGADAGCYVEGDVLALLDAGGIALMQDAQNYICVFVRPADNRTTVRGRIGGTVFGPTAGSSGSVSAIGDRLRLEVGGTAWRVYRSGALVQTGTMAAALTGIRGGFACRAATGANWDNFEHGVL